MLFLIHHWGVQNSLHWTLDITFREDESRIRKQAAPENYAIFRHIALNIIRRNSLVVISCACGTLRRGCPVQEWDSTARMVGIG